MRIAFLAPAYPLRGGIAQFIAILAEKLARRGHEVRIFSFIKQYPKLIFPGKDQGDSSSLKIDLDIVPVLTPYNPLTWAGAVRRIRAWKPDLLILKYWIPFFAPSFGFVVRGVKSSKETRVLYFLDNVEFHEKWPFADAFSRYALGKSDYFITMSQSVAESLARLLPRFPGERVFKLCHPNYDFYNQAKEIDGDAVRKKLGIANAPTILFFGYIKPYKGLDILIRAIPRVIPHIPDLQVLVAGEIYGDDAIYFDLIEKLDLKDRVRMHNYYITNERVAEFFAVSDAVVQPYRSATQSGISQLAFSFDTPVISTNVGGLPEVIQDGENGFLVPPENPEALAQAIVTFYRNGMRERFVSKIKADREKYSWEPILQAIEGIS